MPILYIVATPIGNLEDITFRAVEILKSVEIIFCEDTRETMKLLAHFGIEKPLVSLHQHSSPEKIARLVEKYEKMAYVSDAGTPGISDPGNKIAALAVKSGIRVEPIPGACAAIAALSVSGMPTDRFMFLGYMPHKSRNKTLKIIKEAEVTVCFYESPHRIVKTLKQLNEIIPNRQLVVARELTKKFETIYRGSAATILEEVKKMPKGEFVVVVGENN